MAGFRVEENLERCGSGDRKSQVCRTNKSRFKFTAQGPYNQQHYWTKDSGAFAKLGLREILDVLICLTIVTVLCTCRAEGVRDIKNYAIIFKNGQNPCPMLQTNVPWLLPMWSSPRCRQSAGSLWSSLCTQPFPSSGIFCLRILLLTAFFPGWFFMVAPSCSLSLSLNITPKNCFLDHSISLSIHSTPRQSVIFIIHVFYNFPDTIV